MLKNILRKILVILLFGAWSPAAETADQDKPVVILETKDGKKVKILASQILKLLLTKMQNMKKAPDNKEMQELFKQSREDLAVLYAMYLKNKSTLLKDPEFLQQLLFTAILLNREMMSAKLAKTMPETTIKAELNEMIEKIPVPMLYKIKAVVLNTADKAQRAISALEAGTSFEQISKESVKSGEFENGNVLDRQTGNQFISLFSNAIPDAVKATLQSYNQETKAGSLIKTPISVTEDNKTTYWVIRIEQVKKGSKKDLPPVDLKDERLKNTIASMAANKQIMQEGVKLLKDFKVSYFKPDGSAE